MKRNNLFTIYNFFGGLLKTLKPPSRQGTRAWAEENRFLTSDITSRPGRMDCSKTPWMLFVMECLDNPKIMVIIARKSAQIAWTETINNYIGRTIDLDPSNIMIAFPSAQRAQKFYKEKLKVYIEKTKTLSDKIGSLAKVAYHHIPYPGGFISLVTAGSPSATKSSVISKVIVEEPDDVKDNVGDQGDGLQLLIQRLKSFDVFKLIFGGTPTDEVFSQVERAYKRSNQMTYQPACHICGFRHELSFENLKAEEYLDRRIDPTYGKYDPTTAYYECPNCHSHWNFDEKNRNVFAAIEFENMGWVATNPDVAITDICGFSFNELLSNFAQSSLVNLMKLKLAAEKEYYEGKDGLLKSFRNNQEGRGYTPVATGLSVAELIAKRLNYTEGVVVYEGLYLTCGIDVQRDRFAIVVRAWGRYGNSWLVTWKEIHGNVLDYADPVWEELKTFLKTPFPHASGNGRHLHISTTTIDSADGFTTELVYLFVLECNDEEGLNVLAAKGIDEKEDSYDIYNEPANMEIATNNQSRKYLSERMGVNVYRIGAHRAHSEVLRRFTITSNIGRHYHCATAYGGYEEGILSCRLVIRTEGLHPIYKKIPNKKKEAIDCEKMALHAFFASRGREFTNDEWAEFEESIIYSNEVTNVK